MILVFGATGTLGSALLRLASDSKRVVRGAARKGANFRVDITDGRAVRSLIRAERPSCVINCAALTDLSACEADPETAERCNGWAPGEMANAAHEVGAAFVQISTDHFFTGDGSKAHGETSEVALVNEYARSKFAGEISALSVPHALVIRTNMTGLRGWVGKPTFLEWAVGALQRQQEIVGFADYFTSTIDSGTLAAAIFDLLEKKATGLFNVAARDVVDKATFLRLLAAEIGVSDQHIRDGSVKSLAPPRAESLGLDVSKAETLLGYTLPVSRDVIANLARARPDI